MEAKKRTTFRRRKIIVKSKFVEGAEYPTKLEAYPDFVRLTQNRGVYAPMEVIGLDPPALEYLIQLWQEVKEAKTQQKRMPDKGGVRCLRK